MSEESSLESTGVSPVTPPTIQTEKKKRPKGEKVAPVSRVPTATVEVGAVRKELRTEQKITVDLDNKSLFAPLEEEIGQYYEWFSSNPPPKVPKEVIFQGAGTETQMPFMHLATCAPAYVIAGRYIKQMGEVLGRAPKVLEVGCGTGIGSNYLKTRVAPEADISGVDFSDEAIAYANECYGKSGVKYIAERAQRLPFENGEFDLVFSVQVLEHISREEAVEFVKEVARVLKDGGLVLVSTPNRELCQDLYCNNPNDDSDRRLIPSHEHEYYLDELRTLFGNAVENGSSLFEEIRVNSQVNLPNRKLWEFGLTKLSPSEGFLGKLKRKASNVPIRLMPLALQHFLGRRSWETRMKATGISYKKIALSNEYHRETDGEKADSYFVVARKQESLSLK